MGKITKERKFGAHLKIMGTVISFMVFVEPPQNESKYTAR